MINWELEKEKLKELIEDKNLSYQEIGKLYNCTGNNIKKQAKKLGINLPKRRCINPKETFNKGKSIKGISSKNICPKCGRIKLSSSKLCRKCSDKERYKVPNKELGYYIGYNNRRKYLTTRCNQIRRDAKRYMENESLQEKVCCYCHNHDFDDILEVHHLKSIVTFDPHTKIKEINNDTNLVWLCPNHHAMLEKGLIKL